MPCFFSYVAHKNIITTWSTLITWITDEPSPKLIIKINTLYKDLIIDKVIFNIGAELRRFKTSKYRLVISLLNFKLDPIMTQYNLYY